MTSPFRRGYGVSLASFPSLAITALSAGEPGGTPSIWVLIVYASPRPSIARGEPSLDGDDGSSREESSHGRVISTSCPSSLCPAFRLTLSLTDFGPGPRRRAHCRSCSGNRDGSNTLIDGSAGAFVPRS